MITKAKCVYEDCTDITSLSLSYFNNFFDTDPKMVTLSNFLESFREKSPLIDKLRATKDEATQKFLKSKLPVVGVNNSFTEGKAIENITTPLPLLEIELDAKANPQYDLLAELARLRPNLAEIMPSCIAAFVTARGKGIAFLFHIDPAKREDSYHTLQVAFEQKGYKVDVNSKRPTYTRAKSYDPDIYINYHATVFIPALQAPVQLQEEKKTGEQSRERDTYTRQDISIDDRHLNFVLSQIEEKEVDITGDSSQWKQIAYALATTFKAADKEKEGREIFHRISVFYPGYNEKNTDYQYNHALKTGKGDVTIGTFYEICKRYGINICPPVWIGPTYGEITKPADIVYKLKEEQYISDIFMLDAVKNTLPERFILDAPTGTGKTTFATSCYPVDIYVPTIDLAKQKPKDFEKLGATAIYADQEINDASPIRFITYSSARRVINRKWFVEEKSKGRIALRERTCVVDEAHNFVTSSSYTFRKEDMFYLYQNLFWYNRTILMTGTPILSLAKDFEEYKTIKIEQEKPKEKPYKIIVSTGDPFVAVIKRLVKKALNLVFLNSKNKGEEFAAQCEEEGFKTQCFNRDTKGNEEHEVIAQENKVNDDVEVLIVTSLFAEGLDIENRNLGNLFVMDTYGGVSPITIQQVDSRPRKASFQARFFIRRWRIEDLQNFDFIALQKAYIEEAEEWLALYNFFIKKHARGSGIEKLARALTFEAQNMYSYDKDAGKMVVNELGCGYLAYDAWVKQCGLDSELLKNEMSRYYWKCTGWERDADEVTEAGRLVRKKVQEKNKTANRDEFVASVDACKKLGKQETFKLASEKVFSHKHSIARKLKNLSEFIPFEDAARLLRETEGDGKKYYTLSQQIIAGQIRQYIENSQSSGKELGEYELLMEQLINSIKIGNKYSSEELLDIVFPIWEKLPGPSYTGFTATKATQVAKWFYSAKRTKDTREGVVVNVWEMTGTIAEELGVSHFAEGNNIALLNNQTEKTGVQIGEMVGVPA